jgi:uncharacterized protein (TIGR03435 family)
MRCLLICAWLGAAAAVGQSFEAASIRVHSAAVDQPILKVPGANPINISGSRVALQAVALKDLVTAAYGVKEYQVTGGPGWAAGIDSMFDVEARAAHEPSMAEARAMLQSLLADRFHLKLRRESKQLPVYNLVVAKNGPKVKSVAPDAPLAAGMRRGSMDQIAALWSLYLDRPVIDKTGLTGGFDYSTGLMQLDNNAADSADVIARALATLQEQLGLRAEPARATLEMLVIESAEKPSAN